MKNKRRQNKSLKWFVFFVILLVIFGYSFFFMEYVVKPNLAGIGETRARVMVTQAINEIVREKFMEDIESAKLLDIKTNEEGKVTMVQADSVAMTRLSYDLAARIQNHIKNIDKDKVLVPIGAILGSELLAQTGPSVAIKILPLGSTSVSFNTEFEETGINQTKYKVYLEVETNARVMVPFASNEIDVNTILLISETVIIGDVPQTYIMVPEEDIMDTDWE
ncbi:MAG: sporulation protein YunB [Clostridiales bacterium]|jgi:sporulation protein YunB|nr:sporulation protein YunB [Clostridiales bacterium]